MFDDIVARYHNMLDYLGLDTFAYTVTVPDSGVLSVEDAVRRLHLDQPPNEPHRRGALHLYQVGPGVVTLDWVNLGDREQMIQRLAGDGFRHWYVSFDIHGSTSMYVRYGIAEGYLDHPEPASLPSTPWTDLLGPLMPFTKVLAGGYDSEGAEASVDITAACLAVVELESGVRLDEDLMHKPHSALPIPIQPLAPAGA
ncbi:hypothetical protein [Nonomuraea guangzhouensis]|uniref:Uncharacterized protein n=1 Tax=Nonomuraea guangzhouensis TaxID=1291555 RepID=A0ABW4GFB1_9ACTN|nr:hypothetical protein [Nonomuraea guangzhouensis]